MFTRSFTAEAADIDMLGHVNNTVWVRWIQDMAGAHWDAQATPAQIEAYIWVVVRHEIDYRGNMKLGETVEARTWIDGPPSGAKFDRHVVFERDGKMLVQARTSWALIDRHTHRLLRVPKDIIERFPPSDPFALSRD